MERSLPARTLLVPRHCEHEEDEEVGEGHGSVKRRKWRNITIRSCGDIMCTLRVSREPESWRTRRTRLGNSPQYGYGFDSDGEPMEDAEDSPVELATIWTRRLKTVASC